MSKNTLIPIEPAVKLLGEQFRRMESREIAALDPPADADELIRLRERVEMLATSFENRLRLELRAISTAGIDESEN